MSTPRLVLQASRWYGWQMVPGYTGERNVPYFSPIYLRAVTPKKTGQRRLTLQFLNAQYAQGVEEFSLDLRILMHASNYIVGQIVTEDLALGERAGIVSHIEFEWIRRCCSALWAAQPPEAFGSLEQHSVSHYLDALFDISARQGTGQ